MKKLLSLFLSAVTLIGSSGISMAEGEKTVQVYAAAQSYGAFMAAPQMLSVSENEAEKYGYTDFVEGVSALDVLVKEHEVIFGDEFTAESKGEYLCADGYVSTIFGVPTSANGFLLNGGYPNDGTESAYGGYNGTTVFTQEVKDNDKLDFFIYQDNSNWSDKYTWLDCEVSENTLKVHASGSMAMYGYMYKTPEDFKAGASALCGAGLAWVDENGGLTAVDGVLTDNGGNAEIAMPSSYGEKLYLTATGEDDSESPVIMNIAEISSYAPPTPSEPDVIHVSEIKVQSELKMTVGEQSKLGYTVLPENASDKSVTVTSSDETVIKADGDALTALKAGSAEITVTANDGNISGKCTAVVTETPSALDVMHAIAKKYSVSGIAADQNAQWLAADMAAYERLYGNVLSEKQKQEFLNSLIEKADSAKSAGDISKAIIALRALGYDPSDVVTSDQRKIDMAEKLDELIAADDKGVKNIYTLPYVIIAADGCGMDSSALVSYALEAKQSWQDTKYGTDAATPMLAALAPHSSERDDIKAVISETAELVKKALTENQFSKNAASIGLAITAFSACGENADDYVSSLMAYASDTFDGFNPTSNTFSTEQGFRGLVSWQLAAEGKKGIFDFSDNPKNQVRADWAEYCPVTFEVIPSGATVTVDGETAVFDNSYDLKSGEYSYKAEKDGYISQSGKITVSEEEAAEHKAKKVKLSLAGTSSGSNKISVNISVMAHSEDKCGGEFTYKKNSSSYKALAKGTVSLSSGQTVFDALDKLLKDKNISYTEKTVGYISQIGDYSEFDHGKNSGWMFMVGGKVSEKGCRDTYLNKSTEVIWFYTDDYTNEYGSEKWSSGGGSGSSSKVTVKFVSAGSVSGSVSVSKGSSVSQPDDPKRDGYSFGGWYTDESFENKYDFSEKVTANITIYAKWDKNADDEEIKGLDKSNKNYDDIKYAYDNKYINGTENGFEAELPMTRAMVAEILFRIEGRPKAHGSHFKDVAPGAWYEEAAAWASENGIINGIDVETLAPDAAVTRQQLAAILYRYAEYKKYSTESAEDISSCGDKADVAGYAESAFGYLYSLGIMKLPENSLKPNFEMSRNDAISAVVQLVKLNNK